VGQQSPCECDTQRFPCPYGSSGRYITIRPKK